MPRVEIHLYDGRILDLSDMTVDEMVARLSQERIVPEMVKETIHFIDKDSIHARPTKGDPL
jgi:hypothetical protein